MAPGSKGPHIPLPSTTPLPGDPRGNRPVPVSEGTRWSEGPNDFPRAHTEDPLSGLPEAVVTPARFLVRGTSGQDPRSQSAPPEKCRVSLRVRLAALAPTRPPRPLAEVGPAPQDGAVESVRLPRGPPRSRLHSRRHGIPAPLVGVVLRPAPHSRSRVSTHTDVNRDVPERSETLPRRTVGEGTNLGRVSRYL